MVLSADPLPKLHESMALCQKITTLSRMSTHRSTRGNFNCLQLSRYILKLHAFLTAVEDYLPTTSRALEETTEAATILLEVLADTLDLVHSAVNTGSIQAIFGLVQGSSAFTACSRNIQGCLASFRDIQTPMPLEAVEDCSRLLQQLQSHRFTTKRTIHEINVIRDILEALVYRDFGKGHREHDMDVLMLALLEIAGLSTENIEEWLDEETHSLRKGIEMAERRNDRITAYWFAGIIENLEKLPLRNSSTSMRRSGSILNGGLRISYDLDDRENEDEFWKGNIKILQVSEDPFKLLMGLQSISRYVESREEFDVALSHGIVGTLVSLLKRQDHWLLCGYAANALRFLAKDVKARESICQVAIPPLIQLLKTQGSAITRVAATRAISNLVVSNAAAKIEVTQFGGAELLAAVLEHDGEIGQEAAAAALANLAASSEESQSLIAAAGCIPLLVDILVRGNPAARMHALRALRNLTTKDCGNRTRLAQAKAFEPLSDLLLSDVDGERHIAALAISNAAACNLEAQTAASAAGAVPRLLTMLSEDVPGCREAAAWALSNLSRNDAVRRSLTRESFEAPLVGLLKDASYPGCQHAAAQFVKGLTTGEGTLKHKDRLVEEGVIQPLLAMLSSQSVRSNGKNAAVAALCTLSINHPSSRTSIVLAHGLPPLISLLKNGECAHEVLKALATLSLSNECNQLAQIVEEGAVPYIVTALESSSALIREAAANCLANVSSLRKYRGVVIDNGALPVLLSILQTTSYKLDKEASVRCIAHIAWGLEDKDAVILFDFMRRCITPLVSIISSTAESTGLKLAAAKTLCNGACASGEYKILLASSDAPTVLVLLLQSPSEDLRTAAATALWDLSYECTVGRDAVARAGAVPWLAQLLLFGSASARESAAMALAELATAGSSVRKEIKAAGAVHLLESLTEGQTPREVQLAAREALCSLEANSSQTHITLNP